jgi:periplasmic protein TonB
VSEQLPDVAKNPAARTTLADDPDKHLERLLGAPNSLEKPFLRSLIENVKELIHPTPLPPLEVTSKPVEMANVEGTGLGSVSTHSDQADDADYNLRHLLPPASIEAPLYKSILNSIKEMIHPPKLPPMEVTSEPVDLPSLRGLYKGNEWKAGLSSIVVNGGIVLVLLILGTNRTVQQVVKEKIELIAPDLRPLPPKPQISHGGGGSPNKTPVTKAELPKPAPRQFTAPVKPIENPRLVAPASIVAPQDIPNIQASNFGDPLAGLGIPSAGNGIGTGIGPGRGPGVGPGSGGGTGGGAYRIGGGVSAPTVLVKSEPEYSEEARKAKWQGTVLISLVVDEQGLPKNIKVVRALGLGLDEKAIEAVQKWRFKPGTKDGKPVPVQATIEVNFRLL